MLFYAILCNNLQNKKIEKPLKILGKSAFSRVFLLAQREGFELSKKVVKSRGLKVLTKI